MHKKLSISFPHMGDYYMPIQRFLQTVFPGQNVFASPRMTKKTIEIGSRYSPDYVCSPFKYNVGNFIESLELGANVLFQTGMGCRYGYYGELQEQILKDLGYDFEFICLSRERATIQAAYQSCKNIGSPVSFPQFCFALLFALKSIWVMDKFDYLLRERIGFEVVSGSFEKLQQQLFTSIKEAKSLRELHTLQTKYMSAIEDVMIKMPENPLRVGIVGELYTIMEPFSNFFIERLLAENNILVSRQMSVSFLFFGKRDKTALKQSKDYLKFTVGANGVDSVAQSNRYADNGYDGIIHMKSFGCTPELNATPALMNLSGKRNIPILHLSFDAHTSEVGIQTRIEAFADMITMKREKRYERNIQSGGGHRIHINQGRHIGSE